MSFLLADAPYSKWLPWDATIYSDHSQFSQGHPVDWLINVIHYFMIALFVGWGFFFVYCLWRFRARTGHAARYDLPKAKVSKYSEIAVCIVEVVLLVFFSIPVWAAYKSKPALPGTGGQIHHVRAIGQQFQWNFHYPGPDGKYGTIKAELINASQGNPLGLDDADPATADDIVSPELHVPISTDPKNTPNIVAVDIRSKDVIHSFAIPVLRVKQDAIPGLEFSVSFQALKTTKQFQTAMSRDWLLDGEEFQREMIRLVAMQEYKAKDGSSIVAAGGHFNEDAIKQLKAAGVTAVQAAPGSATEVVCAQLCGNNHYKMKAPLVMETQAEYDAWLKSMTPSEEDTAHQTEEEFEE